MSPVISNLLLLSLLVGLCAGAQSATGPTTRLVTLDRLPDVSRVHDVKFARPLNVPPGEALTVERLIALLAGAKPLNADDPTISDWSYAPWYSGSFESEGGTYQFQLYLGGRGTLVTPSGKRGMFTFEQPQAEDLMFRKEIAPEAFIIVKRSVFDASLMESIDSSVVQGRGRPFTISVEVHRNGKQALLGSSVLVESDDFRSGFHVLDVAWAEGDIVVACSVYDLVGLWRIPANTGLAPKPGGWAFMVPSRFAARAPLKPGEIEVSLFPPTDGLWSVKVTDKRVAGSPTTIFKQSHSAWTFTGIDAGK